MADSLRLMCILAHPDDETLGWGGTLAKYAAEGVETYLLTATRGQRGWAGESGEMPEPDALGKMREKELQNAAEILGIREVCLLDYMDGDLDQAEPTGATREIVEFIRRIKPQVVSTFAPDGAYGHPDHIAISQLTAAALVCAADPTYEASGEPHRVAKVYHRIDTQVEADLYQAIFNDIVMMVDGVPRRMSVWPDWAVSAHIDAHEYGSTVFRAVLCHQSQLPRDSDFMQKLEAAQTDLARYQNYARVYSMVNAGRTIETDLFEGLR